MSYSKSITEIIPERFSCRSYLEQSVKEEQRRLLADFLSTDQTGPLGTTARFELVTATEQDRKVLKDLGTYGVIKEAAGFIIGAARDGEKNLEDFGYLMERIILFATDIGLGTCWLGGSFDKSSFAQKISISKEEHVPAVASVGYIAKKPRSQGTDAANRLPWEQLFFDARFSASLSREEIGDYATPLEMVRLGPSASNKQPWRIIKDGSAWHFYLQRTPGYMTEEKLTKIADLQRIDMGIAMSHFELTARELDLEGRWEMDEPGIEKADELTEYTVSWVN
ncbi:MAG: nitroreductase [Chloroflexi bacterium]|nr:nitroreductase [Chloroflexota bacterium]